MKKNFSASEKIRAIFALVAFALAIIAFVFEGYSWLLEIVFILIAVNLLIMGFCQLTSNKKSLFAYFSIVAGVIIIILQIN
ncbi:hypothetical protein NYE67_07815 [Solibacillus sp. FSL W8-0474]|uniref:hypothetical protein n=1 Tax=Solibacillus sp. FSL W8-0474 TaxID=2975336 RepID=UPI0030FA5669